MKKFRLIEAVDNTKDTPEQYWFIEKYGILGWKKPTRLEYIKNRFILWEHENVFYTLDRAEQWLDIVSGKKSEMDNKKILKEI